ncbi:hypothetical protein LCGC14_1303580 [marine sediment metagenome]|uniref:SLH domain-containing protein n=1 Tax=marine sediment metagenome TaxID=412755 RepID=A0A0F9N5K0_9ZZZZ
MGDPNLLYITGGTPEQHQCFRNICAWPAVPNLARRIHVNLGWGYPNIGGATGFSMDSRFTPDPRFIGYNFLHEYAHVWDHHFLTFEDRQAIIDLHNMPNSWFGGLYLEMPAERFAGTFGEIMMTSKGYFVTTPFESVAPPFTDIGDLSQESQDAIMWLYNEGITKGTTLTTYSPADPVTREQMALYLKRGLGS